jgi:hypothetical protein
MKNCYVEVYLQKLWIVDAPKEAQQKDYEVMLISSNDKLKHIRDRISESRNSDEFRLWKMEKPDAPFSKFYQDLK